MPDFHSENRKWRGVAVHLKGEGLDVFPGSIYPPKDSADVTQIRRLKCSAQSCSVVTVFPFTPCRDVRVLRATKPYAEQIQWVLFLGGARGNDQAS